MQDTPHSEAKFVRCIRGSVWDVVDLRRDSRTYGQIYFTELNSQYANALLILEGCAHGFQVLEPSSELLYLHSGPWVIFETGVRWNDPALAVPWPLTITDISERDRTLPLLHTK